MKGVNEGAQALEEEDSVTVTLEQQASTSDSKLNALLEEVSSACTCAAAKLVASNACHVVLHVASQCESQGL